MLLNSNKNVRNELEAMSTEELLEIYNNLSFDHKDDEVFLLIRSVLYARGISDPEHIPHTVSHALYFMRNNTRAIGTLIILLLIGVVFVVLSVYSGQPLFISSFPNK
ncbi:MAG: hypothetical protein PHT33_03465 [bacterium]|nr:hypothetical protein [bacterium]